MSAMKDFATILEYEEEATWVWASRQPDPIAALEALLELTASAKGERDA